MSTRGGHGAMTWYERFTLLGIMELKRRVWKKYVRRYNDRYFRVWDKKMRGRHDRSRRSSA